MAPVNKKKKETELPFGRRLVLFHWALSLFGAKRFEDLARTINEDALEGWTTENRSKYLGPLLSLAAQVGTLDETQLTGYDEHIYHHSESINTKRRKDPVTWKYFQYLALLFVEIYLDRYFGDKQAFVEELNKFLVGFNADLPSGQRIADYTEDDLNKLAFWSATGSGKTLLMHVHLLQYEAYRKQRNHDTPENLMLLTPNEGLSNQHLDEFAASGIQAASFDKALYQPGQVHTQKLLQVIEISKLQETSGEKTVAIEAFGSKNLLMVDEGHRGAEGEAWMKYRRALCADGFSFEYSATFGQAVGRGALAEEYAKCILFDYSYAFFYRDGYGKDYKILNLDDKKQAEETHRFHYLTAALLAFYQQLRYFEEQGAEVSRFLIERPLWIFVGGSVNALRTENKKIQSDVVEVLHFFAQFLANPKQSTEAIGAVLQGEAGLAVGERDVLTKGFAYLRTQEPDIAALHQDLCERFFNGTGGKLHIEMANKKEGELLLKCGENEEPFGVINVGDADKLFNAMAGRNKKPKPDEVLLAQQCAEVMHFNPNRERSETYFSKITSPTSRVHLLIGSKKFTEGWSSWRVSSIGLMRIGQSEGPQIIQLFGRGVRLKGYQHRLKRSSAVGYLEPPAPVGLPIVETLNLFGIQANYMDQFRKYLEAEECSVDDQPVEIEVPVRLNLPASPPLWQPKIPGALRYKSSGGKPALEAPGEYFSRYKITVDWYPKLQGTMSDLPQEEGIKIDKQSHQFKPAQLALLDWDRIYFAVQALKAERGWHNLCLTQPGLKDLFLKTPAEVVWYEVLIPAEQMELKHYGVDVARWQEIATTVIKKYVERFYKKMRAEWEQDNMKFQKLEKQDPNLIETHRFSIAPNETEAIAGLRKLAQDYEAQDKKGEPYQQGYSYLQDLKVFLADRHLYDPLVYVSEAGSSWATVSPTALNKGERDFVEDLQTHLKTNPTALGKTQLHLLRNQSKGQGLGFFDEGGFYPDFILWLIDGERQHVAFIDPKGLQHMHGGDFTRKVEFSKTIKKLGQEIKEEGQDIELHSFILSSTQFAAVHRKDGPQNIDQFNQQNVFFREEQLGEYVGEMLQTILS